MNTYNPLESAIKFINSTSTPLFLTGKAGTGKTTFLRELHSHTFKKHIVVAPTGIAALNAKGVTIHSQFLLPLGTFIPEMNYDLVNSVGFHQYVSRSTLARKHPLNSIRKKVLREIDLLVIDEVSMLRADVLDAIDYRLRSARKNFNVPFGGVQVLFIGDLFQLPPIVSRKEQTVFQEFYKSAHFFEAKVFQQTELVTIELTKIYRQSDEQFIQVLNNFRNNVATPNDVALLNNKIINQAEQKNLGEIITLTTHNDKADLTNQTNLRALPTKAFDYEAIILGDFPESMYPIPERIQLKDGAQIIFIKNDGLEGKYFNGKLATVVECTSNSVKVKLADSNEVIALRKEKWENKKYSLNAASTEIEEEVIGSFEHYPIKLAWAITVHKSQGLTFEKAIVDVSQAFAPGQIYVALSRLKSLNGLYLSAPIKSTVISSDVQVNSFVHQQKAQEQWIPQKLEQNQEYFIQELLLKAFDFKGLINIILGVHQKHNEKLNFEDNSINTALPQILELFANEAENTLKFIRQLQHLYATKNTSKFLERLQKGSAYYQNFCKQVLRLTLEALERVKQYSKTKAIQTDLIEIEAAILSKWHLLAQLPLLMEAIATEKVYSKNQQVSEAIVQQRNEMISELENDSNIQTKKSAKKSGRKAAKGATYLETLKLIQEGKSIAEIALERNYAVTTIEGHICKLIESKQLNIYDYFDQKLVQEIAKTMAQYEFTSLSEFKELSNTNYTYFELRATQHYINSLTS